MRIRLGVPNVALSPRVFDFSDIIPPVGKSKYPREIFTVFHNYPGGDLPEGEDKRNVHTPHTHVIEMDKIYAQNNSERRGREWRINRYTHGAA